jgi:signal peptidase II
LKKKYLFFEAIIFVVILDQISKLIVKNAMYFQQSVPVIGNVLHITYTTNTGAGFGILHNMNAFLIWVSIIIIGIILYYYNKIPETSFPQVCTALIVGGAVGNLIDRIFIGHVIDFIDFRIWPVFNLADSAVTIGAIGLIIFFWKK